MRKIKAAVIFLISIYVLACIALYFYQSELILNPTKLPEDYVFREGEEVEIQVDENIYLNSILIKEPPSKGVILYLHGNRGHNARCIRQTRVMQGHGYDIFMPDYRGFGKSDGKLASGRQLYRDMQIVYDYLKTKYDESQIVVVGYSLGTGPASWLATKNDFSHLLLISPYVSMMDLKNSRFPIVPDFLIKYPLNNRKNLKGSNEPVTLFHGTEDNVIPFESSEKLRQIDPGRISLIPLDAGHRRTIFHEGVGIELSSILK